MKNLILSISSGSVHERAAEAVKNYMEDTDPGCSAEIIDILQYINPIIDKLSTDGYFIMARMLSSPYCRHLSPEKNEECADSLNKMLSQLLSLKLWELIKDYDPDVITATHPFHLEMINTIKERSHFHIPVIALVTDFSIMDYWVYNYVDAYVVSDDNSKDQLIKWGISQEKIFPYGMPVNPKYIDGVDKVKIMERLRLDNKPTILILGDGFRHRSTQKILSSLLPSRQNMQIIVVTGSSIKHMREIEFMASHGISSVKVYNSFDRIHELISISDIIITKSDSLIISEAIVKETPVVILPAISGQEERTADYLESRGAALKLCKDENAGDTINNIMNNHSIIEQMILKSKPLSKPNAVRDICNLIRSYCETGRQAGSV